MKRIFWIFVCSMTLSVSVPCWGQVIAKEIRYPELKGDHLLLETTEGCDGTFMYYKFGNKQFFLYSLHEFENYQHPYYYPVPTQMNEPHGEILYTVKDMRIVGKRCVCCGQVRKPIGEEQIITPSGRNMIYEDYGFVGWIELDNTSGYNNHIKYSISKVDGTSDLRQLDVRIDAGDTLVALVGTTDMYNSANCLVSMFKNGSNEEYKVFALSNSLEQLTDVVFTEDKVITVSKILEDHHSFILRGGLISDLFDMNSPDLTDYSWTHKYITPNHSLNCGYRDTWHSDAAEIKLVAEPQKSYVTVAHDAYYRDNTNGVIKSMALYRVEIPTTTAYTLLEAQFLSAPAEVGETLMDMRYNPADTTVLLLNRYLTVNGTTGSFSKVDLLSGTFRTMSSDYYYFLSMDMPKNGGNSVWIGGVDKNDATLSDFWQKFDYFVPGEQNAVWGYCSPNDFRNACHMDPRPQLVESVSGAEGYEGNRLKWQSTVIPATSSVKERPCTAEYETK